MTTHSPDTPPNSMGQVFCNPNNMVAHLLSYDRPVTLQMLGRAMVKHKLPLIRIQPPYSCKNYNRYYHFAIYI